MVRDIRRAWNRLPVPWGWLALLAHTQRRFQDAHGRAWGPECTELTRRKSLRRGAWVLRGCRVRPDYDSLKLGICYPSRATRQLAIKLAVAFRSPWLLGPGAVALAARPPPFILPDHAPSPPGLRLCRPHVTSSGCSQQRVHLAALIQDGQLSGSRGISPGTPRGAPSLAIWGEGTRLNRSGPARDAAALSSRVTQQCGGQRAGGCSSSGGAAGGWGGSWERPVVAANVPHGAAEGQSKLENRRLARSPTSLRTTSGPWLHLSELPLWHL